MNFNTYQKIALTTDSFGKNGQKVPVTDMAFVAKILGLVGESGEVAEKIKKIIRNNDGQMSEEERLEVIKELGDVLWYISTLSSYLGADLEAVAQTNIDKLADRRERDVIASTGDNR